MFINMDGVFETYKVEVETYIEDKMINKQTIRAPKEIIMMQFAQLYEQVKQDKRPIKIKMTRPETIWDSFENKQKVITNIIAFSNNAMIAFEESKVGGTND
jgi:hypothetical protein